MTFHILHAWIENTRGKSIRPCAQYAGADPGFQVRGAHLNKMRRAEGGAKNFGIFRVKNHDFYAKKSYFFQF